MPVDTSKRVRLERQDRNEALLAAARQLFSSRPYASVTITELAEAAGTTRTNLHYHFGTKRDLFVQVLSEFAEVPVPRVVTRLGQSRRQSVELLFARWLDVIEANPQMYLVLMRTQAGGLADTDITAVLEQSLQRWQDRLLALVDMPVDSSAARAAIRSFQSLVSALCSRWLIEDRLTKDDVRELLTNTLLAIGQTSLGASDSPPLALADVPAAPV